MEDHEVSFKWVMGHAGHPLNELRQLATEAADGSNLLDDQKHLHTGSARLPEAVGRSSYLYSC